MNFEEKFNGPKLRQHEYAAYGAVIWHDVTWQPLLRSSIKLSQFEEDHTPVYEGIKFLYKKNRKRLIMWWNMQETQILMHFRTSQNWVSKHLNFNLSGDYQLINIFSARMSWSLSYTFRTKIWYTRAGNEYHDKGKKYLQLHSDFLLDQIQVEPDQEKGFRYLQAAAKNGDNYSNYWIARTYHTGNGLPDGNEIDFDKAIKHYLNINEEISNFDIPFYSILGKSIFSKS